MFSGAWGWGRARRSDAAAAIDETLAWMAAGGSQMGFWWTGDTGAASAGSRP